MALGSVLEERTAERAADADTFPDVAITAMNNRGHQPGRGGLTGQASVSPPPLQRPCGLGQFTDVPASRSRVQCPLGWLPPGQHSPGVTFLPPVPESVSEEAWSRRAVASCPNMD